MSKAKSYICVLLAAMLWGMTGVGVTGLSGYGFSRMQVIQIRVTLSILCMLPLMLSNRKLLKVRLKDIWCFIGTGIVSLFTFNICYFNAMKYTTLAVAAVLLYTAPAFVMLLSAVLFKNRITVRKVIALILIAAGCIFVTGVLSGSQTFTWQGILLGIGSGITYALYSIFGRYALMRGYSTFTVSFYTFVLCGLACLPFSNMPKLAAGMTGVRVWMYSLMLSVLCCVLPYILYTLGLKNIENSKASLIACAEPVVATLISIFIYDEAWSWMTITGIALILTGITVMEEKKKKKEEKK